MSPSSSKSKVGCCDHGGKRQGCGRKPGVKTQAIRLPKWLLERLNAQGDARQMIVEACTHYYRLSNDGAVRSDD